MSQNQYEIFLPQAPTFSFERLQDSEGLTAFVTRSGGFVVVICEETAIDSYNVEQEVRFSGTPEQAHQLRDWLIANFPIPTQAVDE